QASMDTWLLPSGLGPQERNVSLRARVHASTATLSRLCRPLGSQQVRHVVLLSMPHLPQVRHRGVVSGQLVGRPCPCAALGCHARCRGCALLLPSAACAAAWSAAAICPCTTDNLYQYA